MTAMRTVWLAWTSPACAQYFVSFVPGKACDSRCLRADVLYLDFFLGGFGACRAELAMFSIPRQNDRTWSEHFDFVF